MKVQMKDVEFKVGFMTDLLVEYDQILSAADYISAVSDEEYLVDWYDELSSENDYENWKEGDI